MKRIVILSVLVLSLLSLSADSGKITDPAAYEVTYSIEIENNGPSQVTKLDLDVEFMLLPMYNIRSCGVSSSIPEFKSLSKLYSLG